MAALTTLLLLAPTAGFHVLGHSTSSGHRSTMRVSTRPAQMALDERSIMSARGSAAMDAWAKYVLLRPGMTLQELKVTTQRTLMDGENLFSFEKRAPGTVRTVILTHLVCLPAALPALLSNPQILPKL